MGLSYDIIIATIQEKYMKKLFNSYLVQKEIYDLPSIEDEDDYVPYSFEMSFKFECDNLDNIIEND